MAVVTGNPQVDYVITVLVTYLVTFTTMGVDLIKKFYLYYPDVAVATSIVFGTFFLIYFMRNIVSIVYGLVVTLIKLAIVLSIVAVGSWVYFRGFDKFQGDAIQLYNFISHYQEHSLQEVKDYASSVKDNTATLRDFVASQYQTAFN